jgi:DNA-binding transcriptional LysR family regulator
MEPSLDLLSDLEIFLHERHVTRSAKRLGITQAAASQRLAKLRAHFGDPLLVTGRDGLVLTSRAQSLQAPLGAALSSLRRAVQQRERFDPAESRRRFVLLGGDLVEAYGVPKLLRAISAEAPHVTLAAERADAQFARRLEDGTADVAFLPNFMIPPSLRRLALPREPFVVLLRRGHPKARRALRLDDYLALDHLLIAPHGLPGSLVDQALAQRGHTRRVAVVIQHFVSAPFIVAESDLALTCPATLAEVARAHLDVRVMPVPLDLALDETSMVWHDRVQDDPSHAWLRQIVAKQIRPSTRRS